MEDELKPPKKKRSKKDDESGPAAAKEMAALAKFTSSDMIRQVKAGLSFIAPMDAEDENDLPHNEEPPL